MKPTLYTTLLFSLIFVAPSFASDSVDDNNSNHGEQTVGFTTGSAVGGVIAGPPGIIVGEIGSRTRDGLPLPGQQRAGEHGGGGAAVA